MRKIDRFLQYIKYKGITENKATRACGLAQGLLNQAKTGKSDLGDKSINKISNIYQDLNIHWLLTGEGEMLKDDTQTDETPNENRVDIPREAFDQISKLTETIMKLTETVLSQQKTIEALEAEIKKSRAQQEEHAISADVKLSNVG